MELRAPHLSSKQDHSKRLLLMLILSRMEILQHEEKLGMFWGCGGQLGETSEFWWPLGHDTETWKTVVPQWGT